MIIKEQLDINKVKNTIELKEFFENLDSKFDSKNKKFVNFFNFIADNNYFYTKKEWLKLGNKFNMHPNGIEKMEKVMNNQNHYTIIEGEAVKIKLEHFLKELEKALKFQAYKKLDEKYKWSSKDILLLQYILFNKELNNEDEKELRTFDNILNGIDNNMKLF